MNYSQPKMNIWQSDFGSWHHPQKVPVADLPTGREANLGHRIPWCCHAPPLTLLSAVCLPSWSATRRGHEGSFRGSELQPRHLSGRPARRL